MLTTCTACGRQVSARVVRCPFCNAALREAPPPPAGLDAVAGERCPMCNDLLPRSRYCRRCNRIAHDERPTVRCAQCGRVHGADLPGCPFCSSQAAGLPPPPPAFAPPAPVTATGATLPWLLPASIFSILCCCTPAGIVSLVFAIQAQNHASAGRYGEAAAATANGRTWFFVSLGLGLVLVPIVLLAQLADLMQAGSGGGY